MTCKLCGSRMLVGFNSSKCSHPDCETNDVAVVKPTFPWIWSKYAAPFKDLADEHGSNQEERANFAPVVLAVKYLFKGTETTDSWGFKSTTWTKPDDDLDRRVVVVKNMTWPSTTGKTFTLTESEWEWVCANAEQATDHVKVNHGTDLMCLMVFA